MQPPPAPPCIPAAAVIATAVVGLLLGVVTHAASPAVRAAPRAERANAPDESRFRLTDSHARNVQATDFQSMDYHSSVTADQRQRLDRDLQYLESTDFAKAPRAVQKEQAELMNLPEISGPLLQNWIINRAHLIVGEAFRSDSSSLIDGGAYAYENPNVLPWAITRSEARNQDVQKRSQTDEGKPEVISKPVVVMSNTGSAIYVTGKRLGHLAEVNFDGMIIPVTSPRTGILRVGPGLFSAQLSQDFGGVATPAARVFRLATLIHESRHSDGNGQALGFLHVKCPAGHVYENLSACDVAANGPYNIQAGFIRLIISSCTDCSLESRETLHMLAIDNAARVVGPGRESMKAASLRERIETNESLTTLARSLAKNATTPDQVKRFADQIAKYEKINGALREELETLLKSKAANAPNWNAKPEGRFETIPLSSSYGVRP